MLCSFGRCGILHQCVRALTTVLSSGLCYPVAFTHFYCTLYCWLTSHWAVPWSDTCRTSHTFPIDSVGIIKMWLSFSDIIPVWKAWLSHSLLWYCNSGKGVCSSSLVWTFCLLYHVDPDKMNVFINYMAAYMELFINCKTCWKYRDANH